MSSTSAVGSANVATYLGIIANGVDYPISKFVYQSTGATAGPNFNFAFEVYLLAGQTLYLYGIRSASIGSYSLSAAYSQMAISKV